jgi:hypothetical protein
MNPRNARTVRCLTGMLLNGLLGVTLKCVLLRKRTAMTLLYILRRLMRRLRLHL